jgi:hypothetical protein
MILFFLSSFSLLDGHIFSIRHHFQKRTPSPLDIAERKTCPHPILHQNLIINPSTSEQPTHHPPNLTNQTQHAAKTKKKKENPINSILLLLLLEILLLVLLQFEKPRHLTTPPRCLIFVLQLKLTHP